MAPELPWFYSFANRALRTVVFPAMRVRVRVTGSEQVPLHGPLLVVSNHQSNLDSPILGSYFPRPLVFMAKVEAFQVNPLLRWVVTNYGAFPITRGVGDIGAIRTALGLLKQGGALYMAPEGQRIRTGRLGIPHEGAALLASRADAPILPIGLVGTRQLAPQIRRWRPSPVTMTLGAPFRLARSERRPSHATLSAMSHAIMERIAALLPAEQRGEYATPRFQHLTEELP